MTDQEIRDYYNSHLACTRLTLSGMTGYTVPELDEILMDERGTLLPKLEEK